MASPDRFDGISVDQHKARFSGLVELDPTDAERMSVDSTFMAVVVCEVGGASVDAAKNGDLVRTNKFKLHHFAVVRDGKLEEQLYEALPALVGADPAAPTDPQLFEPKADANGEAISPDVDRVEVEATVVEGSGGPGSFALEVVPDDDDDEIFTPGAPAPVSRQPVMSGAPASGAAPRKYADPALADWVNGG